MEYPPLDEEARAQVWRTFLERSRGEEGHDVAEEEVKRLSALDVNGRVIKNMVKAGSLLALHRGERLGFGHLATVLRMSGHSL